MAVSAKEPKAPSLLGDVGLGRVVATALLVLVALALQSTVLVKITILGVMPQLVLVVVLCLAYIDGERVGVVAGFFGGFLLDLQLPQSVLGLSALLYTLLAYAVAYIRHYLPGESVWTPVMVVMLTSAAAEVGYALLAIMLGQEWISIQQTGQRAGLVVLYNTLLTPFVFPVVRRVADRFRPERVYRW